MQAVAPIAVSPAMIIAHAYAGGSYMKASINSWLAWLFAERYVTLPPRGVTRRWLSRGVPLGGGRAPRGATGTGWGRCRGIGPGGGARAAAWALLAARSLPRGGVTCFCPCRAPPRGRGRCHGGAGPRRAAAALPARPPAAATPGGPAPPRSAPPPS